MRRLQKKTSVFKIIMLVFALLVLANVATNYIVSETNYTHNVQVAEELNSNHFTSQGYINDTSILNNFKYTLNQNGDLYSLVISTYNVLNYLKTDLAATGITVGPEIFPDIIQYYDRYAPLALGHLGSNPLAVKWYFNSIGLNAEVAFDRENIAEILASNDISVLFRTNYKDDTEFRAVTYINESQARYYGPNQSFHINNKINIDYKDHFLTLITVNLT